MSSPKENRKDISPAGKAKELIVLFYNSINRSYSDWSVVSRKKKTILFRQSQSCAILCVEELISEASGSTYEVGRNQLSDKEWWEKVKEELTKI